MASRPATYNQGTGAAGRGIGCNEPGCSCNSHHSACNMQVAHHVHQLCDQNSLDRGCGCQGYCRHDRYTGRRGCNADNCGFNCSRGNLKILSYCWSAEDQGISNGNPCHGRHNHYITRGGKVRCHRGKGSGIIVIALAVEVEILVDMSTIPTTKVVDPVATSQMFVGSRRL